MRLITNISKRLEKYGDFYLIPIFSLISMMPFSLLFEESKFFWFFYIICFLFVIFRKKLQKDFFVVLCFIFGVLVSSLHWYYVSKIDLLFFGRVLLFLLMGLCGSQINKERAFVICFLDFVIVLVAGALTYKFWYAVFLLCFLLSIIYLCLDIQYLEFKAKINKKLRLHYSLKLSFFLIACGFVLFFCFPRGAFGRVPNELGLSVSGFSEKMTYQEMTKLLQSKKVVMRVFSTNPAGYYQGVILDHFDGKSWTNSFSNTNKTYNSSNKYFKFPFVKRNKNNITYQFKVLPTREKTIFLPPFTKSLKINPSSIRMDKLGNIKRINTHTKSLIYEVISENFKESKSLLNINFEAPKAIKKIYLQLPKTSKKVKKLAYHLVEGKKTKLEKIQAINSFFQRSFVYSLSSIHSGNPIENFLLTNRKGHCQYFAGAMVLLLRLNGISSRVVGGYSGGTYNAYGDYFTIRQSDAHAWVEVYAKNRWIIIDPTPNEIPDWVIWKLANNLADELSKVMEFFDSSWQTYILYFSQIDQNLFIQLLKNYFKKMPIMSVILVTFFLLSFFYLWKLYFLSFQWKRKYQNKNLKRLDDWFSKKKYPRSFDIGLLEHIKNSNLNEAEKKILFQIQEIFYFESFSTSKIDNSKSSFKLLFYKLKNISKK
ncbi:MAG: hypothetical protein COB02_16310 [Candidatus Cloacimonadota bacterium]|nr:MAG: hypothetical protein COB02_16310 [Candidatus Cloacimonadota bacterium]